MIIIIKTSRWDKEKRSEKSINTCTEKKTSNYETNAKTEIHNWLSLDSNDYCNPYDLLRKINNNDNKQACADVYYGNSSNPTWKLFLFSSIHCDINLTTTFYCQLD